MKKLFIIPLVLLLMTGCQESETVLKDVELLNDVKASGSINSADASIASKGTALSFDGEDDYVEVTDDPSLDITSGLTVAAWIYLESYTEWARVVTKGGSPDDDNNYTMHQTGPQGGSDFGRIRFTGSSPALPLFLESNTQIPLNEWHHVAKRISAGPEGTARIITIGGEVASIYLTRMGGLETTGGEVFAKNIAASCSSNTIWVICREDDKKKKKHILKFWNPDLDQYMKWHTVANVEPFAIAGGD